VRFLREWSPRPAKEPADENSFKHAVRIRVVEGPRDPENQNLRSVPEVPPVGARLPDYVATCASPSARGFFSSIYTAHRSRPELRCDYARHPLVVAFTRDANTTTQTSSSVMLRLRATLKQ
jgi:hypothetical protein